MAGRVYSIIPALAQAVNQMSLLPGRSGPHPTQTVRDMAWLRFAPQRTSGIIFVMSVVDRFSLYIHIPFCRVKCTYCDFNTYTGLEDQFEVYVATLVKEIELLGRRRGRPTAQTVFFGGGTPTVLSPEHLGQVLDACRRSFTLEPDAEITSEANPGTVDQSYLRSLLDLGINRLSFGAQSFNPIELTMLGRLHNAGAIGNTVAAARAAGSSNLNLDLIYGLPNQTLGVWRDSLEEAIRLGPDHISLYSLTLERGTALRAQVARGELPRPDDDLAAEMYELADEELEAAGYRQYEISNWCRPGLECRHNLTYWRNRAYLGFGPGAHSSADNRRWWNVRRVPAYVERLATATSAGSTSPAAADYEDIDPALAMAETVILGLRLIRDGVDLATFADRFGRSLFDIYGWQVEELEGVGLLEESNGRLRLTKRARLLGNQVFTHFLPDN